MNTKKRRQAELLRQQGKTYPEIEKKLHVNRSTLSYWLHALPLSDSIKEKILAQKKAALIQNQKKALAANLRLVNLKQEQAKQWALNILPLGLNQETSALLLTALYLGEGFKCKGSIGLGNSNPKILRSFVNLLRTAFVIDETKLRCFLHLRADQIDKKEKVFWSKVLSIPESQFRKSQFDQRTLGKKTWISYHGVCAVYYYDAFVEKKLSALQTALMDKIITGG